MATADPLNELEKLKEVLFTADQIASEDFPIPSREALLAKDPKDLTIREGNILRLYDTGINVDGAQIKEPLGKKLQELFPYQPDTGGEAHKASPSVQRVNALRGLENKLTKSGFTKGLDTTLLTLSDEAKDKGVESLGLTKGTQAGETLRFLLNRTKDVLDLGGKESNFLSLLQVGLKKKKAPRSKGAKLKASPTAEQFYSRHARVIQNIRPSANTPQAIFKADTERSVVNLWGFLGERLEQMMSTRLYIPSEWADRGGKEGFIKYIKGAGRSPGYVDATNPTVLIPTEEFVGGAKGYKPTPLSPYLQAIVRERIKKTLEAVQSGLVKKEKYAPDAIKLFPNVSIADALEKGNLKGEFADLVEDTVDETGAVRKGMGRNLTAKDNRKITTSLILNSSGLPPSVSAQIIDDMMGKQRDSLGEASELFDATQRQNYLTLGLVGEDTASEVVGQTFLQREQAKAVGVNTFNEIPAKIGLGNVPELTNVGAKVYQVQPTTPEEISQGVPEKEKTVTPELNQKIESDNTLSKAQSEEAASKLNIQTEQNKTEAARLKKEREEKFGPDKTKTPTTGIASQTDELLGEPKPKPQAVGYKFLQELENGVMTQAEVDEAIALREAGDLEAYRAIKNQAKAQSKVIARKAITDAAKKLAIGAATTAIGIGVTGGAKAAEIVTDVALAPTPMGGTVDENVSEEDLLTALETNRALPKSGSIELTNKQEADAIKRELQDRERSKRRAAMTEEAQQYTQMQGAPPPDAYESFCKRMDTGFAKATKEYEDTPFYQRYKGYFIDRPQN